MGSTGPTAAPCAVVPGAAPAGLLQALGGEELAALCTCGGHNSLGRGCWAGGRGQLKAWLLTSQTGKEAEGDQSWGCVLHAGGQGGGSELGFGPSLTLDKSCPLSEPLCCHFLGLEMRTLGAVHTWH